MNYGAIPFSALCEMSDNYYIDRIRRNKEFNGYPFGRFTEHMFESHRSALAPVRKLASDVASCIERIDPFIQRHTASVCPHCQKVCCIHKHSYQEYEDIIYLRAIGEKIPSREHDIPDSDPCRFLNEQGCSIKRRVRPYRCTWYFCASLIEHMQSVSAAEYRRFVGSLAEITNKREAMLSLFAEVIGED